MLYNSALTTIKGLFLRVIFWVCKKIRGPPLVSRFNDIKPVRPLEGGNEEGVQHPRVTHSVFDSQQFLPWIITTSFRVSAGLEHAKTTCDSHCFSRNGDHDNLPQKHGPVHWKTRGSISALAATLRRGTSFRLGASHLHIIKPGETNNFYPFKTAINKIFAREDVLGFVVELNVLCMHAVNNIPF